MKNKVSSFLVRATALALFVAPISSVQAQEVYSATIGAVAINVPGDSDVMVALPFKQEKEAGGNVTSVAGSVATLGAASLPDGAFDQGEGSFYLYVEDGGLKGRRFDILSNNASTITVASSDLSGLVGSNISIRSHWTLGTLFPEGVGFKESIEAGRPDIEVIVPDLTSEGGGIAANRIFYFYDGAWREVGKDLSVSVDDEVIEPGSAFVVRNNSSVALSYYFFGEVEYGPIAIPIESSDSLTIDNFVAMERPLGLTLNDLQLHSSAVFGPDDRLLVYSMEAGKVGPSKAPVSYLYSDGKWQVEGGDGADVGSSVTIKAGQGLAIRKAAGSSSTDFWVNEWSLAQ